MFKVGIGQDSHKFSKNKSRVLVLGGIKILNQSGLEANSDGDVLIHALCNALESAIGEGSFSKYADKMCEKGTTNSAEYLKKALKNIDKQGYQINNIGINIEAQKPKIEPISKKIKNNLANIMKISPKIIGLVANSGEGLTAFGKGKGIQVLVITSLIKKQ